MLLLTGLACGTLDPTPRPVSTSVWSTPTALPVPTVTTVPTLSPSPTAAVVPTPPEPVERGAIQPGETVRGTLPLFGTDVWTFDAGAGQYVTIGMSAADPSALDTYLELYDAGGVLVAEDDDSGGDTNSLIVEFSVVVTGTFTIRALTYSGSGDYVLNVDIVEPSGGGTLWYTTTVEGVLPASWSRYEWTFEGEEGQVINFAMNATDDVLDCYLELYGPDDVFLTDDDDSGVEYDALIEYYTLPSDGTYSVVTRGGEFGATGAYTLALELTEMAVQGALAYGDIVSATLEPDTRHHWLFDGEAGDVVGISMSGELDTYLELFAPDGVRVAVDDDGGSGSDAAIIAFELPLSGTYRIIARGHDDKDVGKYELTLVRP
ncbi:MAG: PPC domain-containing protein [Anaerolineae bacterium]|nr:PPC domain-containing protein [Anaerolineae bacterium]